MTEKKEASPALEAFIDELLKRAGEHGYHPTIFIGMRHQLGTLQAIEKLVQSGDIQSGFKRLKEIGLIDWSIEAAVVKFPSEFTRDARQCAAWRLGQAGC